MERSRVADVGSERVTMEHVAARAGVSRALVITAFQMKYRQSKFDGTPDAETAAILQVLSMPAVATPAPAPAPTVTPVPVAPVAVK